MKRFYRIALFLIILIFLSTFNPKEIDTISAKNDPLFKIQNIEIKNNLLVNKNDIKKKIN